MSINFTRREAAALPFLGALAAAPAGWNKEWDRALLQATLAEEDKRFDPQENLVVRRVGAEYRYHSALRSQSVHPTRESLDYAWHLFEAGPDRRQRAIAVLDRMLAIQETDPASKWYGLWGWYMEEPAPKMQPADWNWADFNGATLLLIDRRHGASLSAALRERVHHAIRHCARSIQRRNVAMSYTNIAIKGTFVTFAAAELLEDKALEVYARERIVRLAREIDRTGSYAEYNSATYARVAVVNFARMRMLWKDADMLARAAKLEERMWMHIANHWDAPRYQMAGPQSRCYSTGLGRALWIDKALDGRLGQYRPGDADAEAGLHDLRCPPSIADRFLSPALPQQTRELFTPGIQGTTYRTREFSLGTVNRGEFWVQRRPVLAYYGARPACPSLVVRFLKDDYDFSSALLSCTQHERFAMGVVNFRTNGGDKHISLDPLPAPFPAQKLALLVEIANLPADARIDTKEGNLAVEVAGARTWFSVRRAVFGAHQPRFTLQREGNKAIFRCDLLPLQHNGPIDWKDLTEAAVSFTLTIARAEGDRWEWLQSMIALPYEEAREHGEARLAWKTPVGALALVAGIRPTTAAAQYKIMREELNGAPVPEVRLSNTSLGDS